MRAMKLPLNYKHPSCRDVRDKLLSQLLVLGEKVGGEWLRLGVDQVKAFLNLFDLEAQFRKNQTLIVMSLFDCNMKTSQKSICRMNFFCPSS
jgi:hypothetical protein